MQELLWQIKSITYEEKLQLLEFFTYQEPSPLPPVFQEQSWTTNRIAC